VPNKPMVPTAPASLAEPALPSRPRHIGQPLRSRGATIGTRRESKPRGANL